MASVNLVIDGSGVRISCPRRLARALRSEFAAHLVDGEQPLGFLVRPTTVRSRSYVLKDRCGFVLGTARRPEHVLAMLGSHLTALRAVPAGRARFRLRVLTDGTVATACAFPVLYLPAFDERALAGTGVDVVDRLAVDVDATSGDAAEETSTWFGDAAQATGHRRVSATPVPVDRLILAGSPTAGSFRSEHVARVAGEAVGGQRIDVLDAATWLVRKARTVRTVDIGTTMRGLGPLLEDRS